MTESQGAALGLPMVLAVLRRHRVAVGLTVTLGLLAGLAIAMLDPPRPAVQVLVALPAAVKGAPFPAGLATREPVLAAAFRRAGAAGAPQDPGGGVAVTAMTPSVVSVVAAAGTPARARRAAEAVARALVASLSRYPGHGRRTPARVLAPAAYLAAGSYRVRLAAIGGLGGLAGLLAGGVGAFGYDRRRRSRVLRPAGLADIGFLAAALRRRAWLWCGTAVAGLALSAVWYVVTPAAYQASASVLVNRSPYTQDNSAMAGEAAWAHSAEVARTALRGLGLRQAPYAFLSDYSVLVQGDSTLVITAGGPSAGQAVRRADALAAAFLRSRSRLLRVQEQLRLEALAPVMARASRLEQRMAAAVRAARTSAGSGTGHAVSGRPSARFASAAGTLAVLSRQASDDVTAPAAMTGASAVLGTAVPSPRSQVRAAVLCIGGGLAGALTLGVGAVLVGELGSVRLRRRDDVAHALGAPVTISTGRMRLAGRLPGRRGLAAARGAELRRVVRRLRATMVPAGPGPAGLVLIPVGRPRIAAIWLAALAIDCAREGSRVVLADWCPGAPAARLLGAAAGGSVEVSPGGERLIVVTRGRGADLDSACQRADVVLGCAPPRRGDAECPGRWAGRAVVLAVAGRSSAAGLQAVSAEIRQSGMTLACAVLVGADRADLSIGVPNSRLAVPA